MTVEERQMRRFSTAFKIEKVDQIEQGLVSVAEISREYEVSRRAIYKWKDKFGMTKKQERIVVEKQSEAAKSKRLKEKLHQVEREVGRQQMELRYLEEVIQYWSQELGMELKKKVDRP